MRERDLERKRERGRGRERGGDSGREREEDEEAEGDGESEAEAEEDGEEEGGKERERGAVMCCIFCVSLSIYILCTYHITSFWSLFFFCFVLTLLRSPLSLFPSFHCSLCHFSPSFLVPLSPPSSPTSSLPPRSPSLSLLSPTSSLLLLPPLLFPASLRICIHIKQRVKIQYLAC